MSQLTPYLCVADARAAIEWYISALGAEVSYEPIFMDDGRVGHCELAVGDAHWMMSDQFDSAGIAAPDPARGSAVSLHPRSPTSTQPPPASSAMERRWRGAPRTVRSPDGWRFSWIRSGTGGC